MPTPAANATVPLHLLRSLSEPAATVRWQRIDASAPFANSVALTDPVFAPNRVDTRSPARVA